MPRGTAPNHRLASGLPQPHTAQPNTRAFTQPHEQHPLHYGSVLPRGSLLTEGFPSLLSWLSDSPAAAPQALPYRGATLPPYSRLTPTHPAPSLPPPPDPAVPRPSPCTHPTGPAAAPQRPRRRRPAGFVSPLPPPRPLPPVLSRPAARSSDAAPGRAGTERRAPAGAPRAAAGPEVERLSLPASARPPPRR